MAAPIPGLGPINGTDNSDDIIGGPPNVRGASPAPDIAPPQLHPVAQPENYFMQAPQYAAAQEQVTNNVNRLAGALSAFQPALQNFSMVQSQLQHTQADNALAPLQGLAPNDLRDQLQNNPALQNIAGQRLGTIMLGNKIAAQTSSEMTKAYYDGTFDRTNGNFEDFANSYYQRDLKAYGNNPFFARGYNETFDNAKKGLFGEQTKFAMQDAAATRNDLLGTTFSNAIGNSLHDATASGQPPDMDKLMQGITTSMNAVKGVSGMSRPEQAQALLAGVQKQADTLMTDPNWEQKGTALMGLLKQDRGDGAGSLYDTDATGAQSAKLTEHIQQIMDQRFGATTTAVADIHTKAASGDPSYRTDLDALAAQHPFLDKARMSAGLDYAYDMSSARLQAKNAYNDSVTVYNGQKANAVNEAQSNLENGQPVVNDVQVQKPGPNGEYTNETIDSARLQKQAVAQKQDQIDRQFPNAASDPQQAQAKFNTEMNFYGKAGIPSENWKASLNSGFLGAGTALAAGNQPSAATKTGFDTFLNIESRNAPMLSKVATGDTLKFYQAASTYLHAGFNENDALATAARTVHDGSLSTELKGKPQGANEDDDATKSLSSVSGSNWNPMSSNFHNGIPDLSGAANVSEVTDQVKKLAALYQRNGSLSYQGAMDQAAKTVAPQYSMVGNQAVYTGDHAIPPDFGDRASKFIDNWWQTNGSAEAKLGYTKDDLRVRPAGSGAGWYLAFHDGTTPPWSSGAHFGLGDLAAVKSQMDQESAAKLDQNLKNGPSFLDRLLTRPAPTPTPGMMGN